MAHEEAQPNQPLAVGERAPDFQLPAAQGGDVALSFYASKKDVLLIFLKGMT